MRTIRWRPTRNTVKAFAGIAAVLFGAGLVTHLWSFSPRPTISMNQVWPLHFAIFVPFIAMIPTMNSYLTVRRRREGEPLSDWLLSIAENTCEFQQRLMRIVPVWAWVVMILLAAYVAINFILFMGLMEGGSPAEETGKYYLKSHGRILRPLGEAEYRRFLAYEVRGFSGHWLVFSFVPFVYFAMVEPRQRKMEESEPSPDQE